MTMSTAPQNTPHEPVFYEDPGVTVTSARFITPGQTIVMSGVTAVAAVKNAMSSGQRTAFVLSVLFLVFVHRALMALLALLVLAYTVWRWLRPTYGVVLSSASGHQRVLEDTNKGRILKIAAAVNDVIVHRT